MRSVAAIKYLSRVGLAVLTNPMGIAGAPACAQGPMSTFPGALTDDLGLA